jgi:hypothetical protein
MTMHAPVDDDDRRDIETADPEVVDLMRHPGTPTTLSELAALKGGALDVIDARVQVVKTLRVESIRLTSPPDWVAHKAPDEHGGQIICYMQDCGGDRVRDLWGIEIFDVSTPEKVVGNDPGTFHYLITGSGRCKLTRQILERVEGGRSSTDDFCRGVTGTALELLVRKAARANLDGNITRELAGMKSVPIEDIAAAWVGTPKRIEDIRRGRGFGTAEERLGASSAKAPDVEPPICPHCGKTGKYRPGKGDRPAFYGCPDWDKHKDKKWIQPAAEWVAKHATPAPSSTTTTNGKPMTADEVFGNKPKPAAAREPGQEG